MMRWIIEASIKFRFLMVALAIGIIVVGVLQLQNMPADALPEFAPPYIEVQTEVPGLADSEVEELVTFNLEELLNGTPWLESIRSTSVPGLSSITLTFQPGTDVLQARQLVSERLSLAYALPNVAQSPVILQPLSAMSQVMMVGLTSKQVSPIDMSVLARWDIRPALLSVPGVANVAIWGMRDKQIQVQVDPLQLQTQHVQLDQIISTTGNALWVSPLSFLNASTPGSGGWIDTPQQRIEVRHVLPISTPQDLAKVTIENSTLRLGDVANLVTGHPPIIGDDVVNNGPGLLIVIEKFPGANTLEVTRNVEAKLTELQPGLAGIQIDTAIFRPASFVQMAVVNVHGALLIGFLLIIVALSVFMYSLRSLVISLITIPVSLALAILVISLRGATMNTMVLGGLIMALAIIIDDAVINVENIIRRLYQHPRETNRSLSSVVFEVFLETRSVMLYATLILLLALLPIFFLTGVAGAFFKPLTISYALAVIASLVVALTLAPALCFLLLPKNIESSEHRKSPIVTPLQRGYTNVLERFIRVMSTVLLAIITIFFSFVVLIALTFLITFKTPPLLPDFKEPNIIIQWDGPPGTSATEMVRITKLVSRELRTIPGVLNVAASIGRAVLGSQVVNVNSAKLIVSMDPEANYDATIGVIQKVVNGYPGIFHVVQTYLKERVRQVLTGSSGDITVRIFGTDLDVLRSKAMEARKILSQIPGITDIHIEQQVEQPQITIQVDLVKAQHYGLKPGDVRRAAATLIAGLEVGSLFQEQKIFPVTVWGTPDTRHSLNSIRNLLINTPSGQWVKLDEVASAAITPTPNLIHHEAVSRRIDLSINVHDRNLYAVTSDIKERLEWIKFPLEFRAKVLGQDQQIGTLLIVGLIAAIAIYLILQAAFNSFRLASIIFFSLPSSLIGGVIAIFLIGEFSFASLLGLFAVFGIAVRNTILQIKYYQNLERLQNEPFGLGLILQGSKDQCSTILMSTFAIVLSLLPLAVSGDVPGLEIVSPMAIIIIGGLITSALFNLLVIPILYLAFGANSSGKETEDKDTAL